VLDRYTGTVSHVNFVRFFVLNARLLELMTFHIDAKVYSEEFLADQRTKLQLKEKASRKAQFHFTTQRCLEAVSDAKHLRDFDINDPFACKC
jgi:protein associated with RNAse G/E